MSKRKKTSPAHAPEAPVEEQDGETTRAEMPAEVVERAVSEEGSPLGDDPPQPEPEPAAAAEQPAIEPEAPSRRARRTRGRASKDTVPDAPDATAATADETTAREASAEAQEPAPEGGVVAEPSAPGEAAELYDLDAETTVNLSGDMLPLPGRDDLDAPTVAATGEELADVDGLLVQRKHLRGLLESLVFASDTPIKSNELAKLASAPLKHVKELLGELKDEYATRGIHLDEVAGGWVFRTSAQYAPFIRDLTKQKPVRLTRAQVETLAIIAYRQPITRPEVDDVRGVDSGPVLKLLLERDLVRILGKRDEPGRPLIYGTTTNFLEFFGLKSLKDLPTLREFTELTDESRQTYEDELGETPNEGQATVEGDSPADAGQAPQAEPAEPADGPHESMRVPIGDDAIDEALDRELEETHAAVRHEADQDDATITSNAPLAEDVEP